MLNGKTPMVAGRTWMVLEGRIEAVHERLVQLPKRDGWGDDGAERGSGTEAANSGLSM
jgi:hypothetical protein